MPTQPGATFQVPCLDTLGFVPSFARMTSPYRNEIESLRAENARLRAELGARRRVPGMALLAACFCVLDVLAILALKPWLNGGDDGRFWAAVGVIFTLAAFAVGSAVGYKRS